MSEEQKTEGMNVVLDVIMLLSAFLAGLYLNLIFVGSIGLLFLAVLLSQIRVVPSKETETEEE